MFFHFLPLLKNFRILLVSKSPRRSKLLEQAGLTFHSISSPFAEDLDKEKLSPQEYVKKTSILKIKYIADTKNFQDYDIIIAADTIVLSPTQEKLGKPKNDQEAFRMISSLQGKTHKVLTGVSLLFKSKNKNIIQSNSSNYIDYDLKVFSDYIISIFHEETEVTFAFLSNSLIKDYISLGESIDKAGAYGIQGFGGLLISSIKGCYNNVVGFPLHSFSRELGNLLKQEYNSRSINDIVEKKKRKRKYK